MNLSRRMVAEGLGTAMLLIAVVGSGIMGERLAGGNVAIALLANSVATGAALLALILTFEPISGAHLNPAVSLAAAWSGNIAWRDLPVYVTAQISGAFAGVALAHLMFSLPLLSISRHVRSGKPQLLGEFVASFGLMAVIKGCAIERREDGSKVRIEVTAFAVAAYITGAYWFTSSTSFANPAVTLARSVSDTFAGIRPIDTPGFIAAQLLGATSATLLFRWLLAVPQQQLRTPSTGVSDG